LGRFIESLEERTLMAFGLTTTSGSYVVDTGAQVVFTVLRKGTSSTVHSGDLTSFKYNGVEFAAPFAAPGPQRYSHFESGLSNNAVVTATVDPAGNWIKITADDTTATVGAGATGVIQYYMAKKNDNAIYMAIYAPEMLVSSTRFITYLNFSKFPNHPNESDTSEIHGTAQTPIENIKTDGSGDVYLDPVDGETHSKYYAENRVIGHVDHGATGPGAGAFMFIGNRESGSGGPFWKDIDFQSTGAAVEMYNIPYSDHSQTDAFRPGLHGPYALVLTNGSTPATPDYSFIDGVGLTGWVSPSARGTLTGQATGIAAGRVPTVALSNGTAQYWGTPDASGNYTIPGIKPGTYVETLYDEELAVGTQTVTISAGTTTTANITDTYFLPSPIFRIGTFDGTPREFLNGDKIADMHPSDVRMTPWADATGLTNYIVGTTLDSAFPMAEWKFQTTSGTRYTDTDNRITFTLTAAQKATPLTLRIGITRLDHGRPGVSINGTGLSIPALSTQPDTRGLTLGSWRGNNTLYTYNISTSSLIAGTNTIDITVASGSGSGGQWLSPYFIYDAVDLVPTSSLANAPKVNSLTIAQSSGNFPLNGVQSFVALAKDQFGNPIPIAPEGVVWSTTLGSIDANGRYTASATAGTGTITASYFDAPTNSTKTATINIVVAPLQISNSSFQYNSLQSVSLTFNRDVDPAMLASALILQNLTTQTTISPTAIHIANSNGVATITFTNILADGNYQLTVKSATTLNSLGDQLSTDFTMPSFFVLSADANHDRTVNLLDLNALATNFGKSSVNFSGGDFDYSGSVGIADFNLLTANFGKTLATPGPVPLSLPSSGSVIQTLFSNVPLVSNMHDLLDPPSEKISI
jgi:rhamnogalacturonan endolyase